MTSRISTRRCAHCSDTIHRKYIKFCSKSCQRDFAAVRQLRHSVESNRLRIGVQGPWVLEIRREAEARQVSAKRLVGAVLDAVVRDGLLGVLLDG